MSQRGFSWVLILLVLMLASSLACSLGGQPAATATPPPPTPTEPPMPTATPEPTATPTPETVPTVDPLRISALDQVRKAVIQIEAEGSFVDPVVGLQMNVAGRGSGFVIDESGIAVTNNHVVTGAGLLRVWVGGEGTPFNARVLGVSECSDLAVIDIEGDGFHYLDWYREPIRVGLEVYAAGFPLGDPEFTLTKGIISKEKADGKTDWASVRYVLEHDATINPGNSGGPLMTRDGLVVGVNYASSSWYSQYFAISREEAHRVIEQLREERNVASIGINGTAVNDGEVSGIWVASVESGSPAERAGIRGGDILTMIEGLTLAEDGTMARYCDVLRSHGSDETMAIQVLRYDTEEVLEGQLNGNELALAFSFAQRLESAVQASGAAGSYDEYVQVSDDTGALLVEVPAKWADIDGSLWQDGEGIEYARIDVAPDLAGFYESYGVPGIVFLASAQIPTSDAAEVLDWYDYSTDCDFDGRYEYSDALYSGYYDQYSYCGGEDVLLIVLAAFPEDYAYATLLLVQVVTDADLEALDHVLNTFVVVGQLPGEESPRAAGGQVDLVSLTVTNQSAADIWYVYISPVTSDSWGDDWLGSSVLATGDSVVIDVPKGEYDLAAADPSGEIVHTQFGVVLDRPQQWTLTAGGSAGGSVALNLVNRSGVEICYVFISPSAATEWGEDWLDEIETIPAGRSYVFTVPVSSTPYDIQALDCQGSVLAEEYEIPLRSDTTWTVNPPQ